MPSFSIKWRRCVHKDCSWILLPFGRQYGTDFEESQVVNWLSVVWAACEDFKFVHAPAWGPGITWWYCWHFCYVFIVSSSSGCLHPHCRQGRRKSASALECLEPGRCIQLGFPASGQLVLLGPGGFEATWGSCGLFWQWTYDQTDKGESGAPPKPVPAALF